MARSPLSSTAPGRGARFWVVVALAVSALLLPGGPAMAVTCPSFGHILGDSSGGNGSVCVGVDGYGSFGSDVPSGTTHLFAGNANFDPIPPDLRSSVGTTFESGLAIRFGESGSRRFLTSGSIRDTGFLTNPVVSGDSTSASSSFGLAEGLDFSLLQTLSPIFSGLTQVGSALTQIYTMENTTPGRLVFELIRYFDGDLGGFTNGGGKLGDMLFETETATGTATSAVFVAITGEGGTIPSSGLYYEVDKHPDLVDRILVGGPLRNTVWRDFGDSDQFIDDGLGYDVTLALLSLFTLESGQTGIYTTRSSLASAPPSVVAGVPEPASLLLLGAGLAALGIAARARRRP